VRILTDATKWFDNLSPEEFDLLWKSDQKIGSQTIREVIEDRIRSPGGLHEWLMAGRADVFKRWGIGMDQIKALRSEIATMELKLGTETGRHGGNLSGRFHNALIEVIDQSTDYRDFVSRLQQFAREWLPNGPADLPPGLRP
jgi:hypothetical protein